MECTENKGITIDKGILQQGFPPCGGCNYIRGPVHSKTFRRGEKEAANSLDSVVGVGVVYIGVAAGG
jgi:hypothetical protein